MLKHYQRRRSPIRSISENLEPDFSEMVDFWESARFSIHHSAPRSRFAHSLSAWTAHHFRHQSQHQRTITYY